MSKSVNLEQYVQTKRMKQHPTLSSKKTQRNIIIACISIIMLTLVMTLAILAYNSNPIFFKNIIASIAIIAMVVFIKLMSSQKTNIKRVKK